MMPRTARMRASWVTARTPAPTVTPITATAAAAVGMRSYTSNAAYVVRVEDGDPRALEAAAVDRALLALAPPQREQDQSEHGNSDEPHLDREREDPAPAGLPYQQAHTDEQDERPHLHRRVAGRQPFLECVRRACSAGWGAGCTPQRRRFRIGRLGDQWQRARRAETRTDVQQAGRPLRSRGMDPSCGCRPRRRGSARVTRESRAASAARAGAVARAGAGHRAAPAAVAPFEAAAAGVARRALSDGSRRSLPRPVRAACASGPPGPRDSR